MTLPRRRRGRPKGRARLTVVKDVQARKDAEEAKQWLSQLKTDPANGTTVPIPLAGLRGQPHYTPPWRPDGERFADPRTWRQSRPSVQELAEIEAHIGAYAPAPVTAPPRTHQAAYGEWTGTTTINNAPASAADHMDDRCRDAHTFLKLKSSYLEQRGMGYRIDDAAQVLDRGEDLPAGSVIADTHAEAVTHLLGDHGIWEPTNVDGSGDSGWNHGWAGGLPWYRPEDGDNGLPLRRGGETR